MGIPNANFSRVPLVHIRNLSTHCLHMGSRSGDPNIPLLPAYPSQPCLSYHERPVSRYFLSSYWCESPLDAQYIASTSPLQSFDGRSDHALTPSDHNDRHPGSQPAWQRDSPRFSPASPSRQNYALTSGAPQFAPSLSLLGGPRPPPRRTAWRPGPPPQACKPLPGSTGAPRPASIPAQPGGEETRGGWKLLCPE
ncbi:hypothetical protein GWK47_046072 [Chionoecetes opilio]|uniref:Uncharacterized protein n=1 Tax=Chionoecetes opilio TaxID=41210 RepID=A0A8J5CTT8_CHIOP|nr:hypothetical protein GWK47_046072 [Chionoecetes opilio]